MSRLPDNKKIALINIPGTHDSAAFNVNSFFSKFAKCQNLNIMEQLKIGVRELDIRVTYDKSSCCCIGGINQKKIDQDLDLICCHGICNCYHINKEGDKKKLTYKEVLLDMKQFLEEFPSEAIILLIQIGRDKKDLTTMKRAIEIFTKIVGDISIKYDKSLTLGEVRGKIIYTDYILDEKDLDGNIIYKSGLDGLGIDKIHQKFVSSPKYDTFKVDAKLKIEEVKDFINIYERTFEEAEKDFEKDNQNYPFNFSISCTGEKENFLPSPESQANIVNKFIIEHDLKKGNYYGWIKIDFVDTNIAKKIIDTNFM